jgi:hypothetical protein
LKSVNKIEKCYVFETKNEKEFVAWWTTIKWSYNNEEKLIKLRQKIRWNSKKKLFQWKQFYEKTTVTKNYSKVICQRCEVILKHFVIDVENSFMMKHLTSVKCKKTFKIKRLKKFSLQLEYRATIKELS